MSIFATKKQFFIVKQQRNVGRSAEFLRVANLPRRVLDLEKVPDLTPIWLRKSTCSGCELCCSGEPRLRAIQSAALLEAENVGGLFAPIGVGHGKELICLLLPYAMKAKRAVILTKPRLKAQMIDVDIPRYGKHFNIPIDRIHVVSYSELSVAKTADILEKLQPDVVIANECHMLRHLTAVKTKRFRNYMKDNPGCKFAGLSGTIANNSLKDYAHLIDLALRMRSPLPAGYKEMEDWSLALDVVIKKGELPLHPGVLLDLCGAEVRKEEGHGDSQSAARRIYRRRLVESPGVIATTGGSCDASLTISSRIVQVPEIIQQTLEHLRTFWEVGGEEFCDAKDIAAKAKQISAGFYYHWVWPNGEKDLEWLEARTAWHQEVRHILRYKAEPGMDSPALVANAAERGDFESDAWEAWNKVRDRWKPHPPKEAVWLSDFLVRDMLKWAKECESEAPGIIWFSDEAIGQKLVEEGLSVYAGGKEGDRILHSRERVVAASLHARRDGDNLQHFCRNLVMPWPANGTIVEQFLGRSHRAGQKADEVECETYTHDQSLCSAFASSVADARFQEETQGTKQKILYAMKIGLDFVSFEEDVWEE